VEAALRSLSQVDDGHETEAEDEFEGGGSLQASLKEEVVATVVESPSRLAFLSQITDAVATMFSPKKNAPAPLPQVPQVAHTKQGRPEKRKLPSGLPTPVRPQAHTGSEASLKGYGEHKLSKRRSPPSRSSKMWVIVFRSLRWCLAGLLLTMLTLWGLYLARAHLGWLPNHSLVGAAVCPAAGLGVGFSNPNSAQLNTAVATIDPDFNCKWTVYSGGVGGGRFIDVFRTFVFAPVIALEFLASKVALIGPDLVARGSGLLEWSFFIGMLLRIIFE